MGAQLPIIGGVDSGYSNKRKEKSAAGPFNCYLKSEAPKLQPAGKQNDGERKARGSAEGSYNKKLQGELCTLVTKYKNKKGNAFASLARKCPSALGPWRPGLSQY